MIVSATIVQEVNINPVDVINNLLTMEVGNGNWVKIVNDKPFIVEEIRGREYVDEAPIENEKYELIKALELVKERLMNKK